MTWLLPSALAIAGAAALITVALHFIARSRPLAEPLPTARFVPQRPVRARTRSLALTDVLLLLIRVLAVLTLGAAVAGPVFATSSGRVARVVLADRSRAVADPREVRDSVRALLRPGDVAVAFDSAAAMVGRVDSLMGSNARGSLSAGLAAALRAASVLARSTDSVELVIVSPLAAEEMDDATPRLRSAWPGRARLVSVRAAESEALPPVVDVSADASDPVVAGLSLVVPIRAGGWIRVVRGRVTDADSAWARDSGHVLVHWPSVDSDVAWKARSSIDAVGGVASATGTMVARFPRLWTLDGEAIARWSDGEPAAVERATGAGCIRDVAILIDPRSDASLRQPFRDVARAFLAPCGGSRTSAPVDSTARSALAGPPSLASADEMRDRDGEGSRWTPWLLALGAALLIGELAMRRLQKAAA